MANKKELIDQQKLRNVFTHNAASIPYYLALEQFVQKYSHLETVMFWALSQVTEVRHEVAKSIFSGTRVSQAKSFINRTLVATGDPRKLSDRLKPVFDHIGDINSARDEILHFGAAYDFDLLLRASIT